MDALLEKCTCKPLVYKICSECDGQDGGCWACENGMVVIDSDVPDKNVVFVHEEDCNLLKGGE